MKKGIGYLGKFLALLLVLGVVGYYIYDYTQRKYWVTIPEDRPILEGVTLELDREVYDGKHFIMTATFTNGTDEPIFWGADLVGRVEQWSEAGWRYWEQRPGKGDAPVASLRGFNSGESTTGEISLRAVLPKLTPGRYRYARYFQLEDGSKYMVCTEFEIE